MEPIDVVMLTKNSDHLLRKCLESIHTNVPVRRLIIVDASSTDETLRILGEYNKKYGNVRIMVDKGTRARAREVGIREVQTEWFMFADSDVILCNDWMKKAEKQIDNSVGAVWGLNIDVIPTVKNKVFLRLLGSVAKECFNLRGGMHDTLIRTEAVRGIKIPEQLHSYEDWFIVNWVKKKGYKVLIGDDIYCLHLRPKEDWDLKESLHLAALELKCGLAYSHSLKYSLYYPFFMFYWVLQIINKNSDPSLLQKSSPQMI